MVHEDSTKDVSTSDSVTLDDCPNATRLPYPTDLTDEEWSQVVLVLNSSPKVGRKRAVDERDIIDAILYMWHSGCSWRMLPHDLPPWTTVYYYYRLWRYDGTLTRLRNLLAKVRRQPARSGL
jgi:putative transposase